MDTEILVEALPLLGVCNLCLNKGAVRSMIVSQKHDGNQELYSDMLLKCFSIDMSALDLADTKRLICNTCVSRLRDAVQFKELCERSLRILTQNIKVHDEERTASQKGVKSEGALHVDTYDDYVVFCDEEDDINKKVPSKLKGIKSEGTLHVDTFDDYVDFCDEDDNINKRVPSKLKGIKSEDSIHDAAFDHSYDDFCDEEDNITLNEFKIKEEPKEDRPRKKTRKTISTKSKVKVLKVSLSKKADLTETEALLDSGLFPFKMRKNGSFSCLLCSMKTGELEELKKHMVRHSKTNIRIAFQKMLFSSYQRFYQVASKLRCKICTTDVSNFNELKLHIDNCVQLNVYGRKWNSLPFKLEKDQLDCPVCKKTFLNYVSLNTHMNVHYPNYICENCGKAFASKARLRGHMRTHEVGTFPCRHCNAVFDRVTKRENHVSKEHKAGVRYACKRCNISLTSFYARQKHLAEVHNEELKRYKCKVCPQSYITPGHLSSHVRRDHLNERNHKCDKCDLAFYTKNALKMHMIKHDGERIHTCHICQKSYQRKKTLREHLRIHNNDKRFVCPVCGRAFTQKCTLKGHLKVHERKVDVDDRIVQPLHSI